MDIHNLTENAQRKLARQQVALKATEDELNLITELEKQQPGSYLAAITAIRVKRDRQAAAVRGTEAYIKALQSSADTIKKALKRA